jgi:tetratricopeptide (TPR) repeat protein
MAESARLEELQRRVQRDPASISFAALAEEYRRLGLFQQAIDVCRAGLQRHPAYLSARVTLGRALLESGEYDEAAAVLEQVLQTAPENLAAIRALAEIHRRRGEMPETIEHYDMIVAEAEPPAPAAAAAEGETDSVQPLPVSSITPAIEVKSSVVEIRAESRSVAGLEEFLSAIQRARHVLVYAR